MSRQYMNVVCKTISSWIEAVATSRDSPDRLRVVCGTRSMLAGSVGSIRVLVDWSCPWDCRLLGVTEYHNGVVCVRRR